MGETARTLTASKRCDSFEALKKQAHRGADDSAINNFISSFTCSFFFGFFFVTLFYYRLSLQLFLRIIAEKNLNSFRLNFTIIFLLLLAEESSLILLPLLLPFSRVMSDIDEELLAYLDGGDVKKTGSTKRKAVEDTDSEGESTPRGKKAKGSQQRRGLVGSLS